MVLHVFSTFSDQCQVLSCDDGHRSKTREWASRVRSLERQGVAHFAELASAHGDLTHLKESVALAERLLADGRSALLTV